MLVKTTLVAALGLAAAGILATSAAAQTAPTAPAPAPAPTQSAPPASLYLQPFQDLGRIEERVWRQSLTETAQTAPTKAQWARARRAAELVNADRCDEAFALARTQKDSRLEIGVNKVCLARQS